MTSDYRLARAQNWIADQSMPLLDCSDRDELARGLASSDRSAARDREFEASEVSLVWSATKR